MSQCYVCHFCGWSLESDHPEYEIWKRLWVEITKQDGVAPAMMVCPDCDSDSVVEVTA